MFSAGPPLAIKRFCSALPVQGKWSVWQAARSTCLQHCPSAPGRGKADWGGQRHSEGNSAGHHAGGELYGVGYNYHGELGAGQVTTYEPYWQKVSSASAAWGSASIAAESWGRKTWRSCCHRRRHRRARLSL